MSNLGTQQFDEQLRRMTPVAAPAEQQAEVVAFSKAIGGTAHVKKAATFQLVGPQGETMSIPKSVFAVIVRVAEVLARGDAFTLVPVGKELTTQQAADLLNVSRQYLVRLLNEGRIAYTKTGKHRRLKIEDVLAFKEERDQARKAGLGELTAVSQELGGYIEFEQ